MTAAPFLCLFYVLAQWFVSIRVPDAQPFVFIIISLLFVVSKNKDHAAIAQVVLVSSLTQLIGMEVVSSFPDEPVTKWGCLFGLVVTVIGMAVVATRSQADIDRPVATFVLALTGVTSLLMPVTQHPTAVLVAGIAIAIPGVAAFAIAALPKRV